jgi:DNA primase
LEGYIPEGKIAEIKDAANIVDVISNYVSLKKVGNNYKGLCPFHSEKTPSFIVNEEKQIFHCFGCNAGGNVFSFLMKMDNLSFPESAMGLARQYGIHIHRIKESDANSEKTLKREYLFKLNELAASYYHNILINEKEGEKARKYLTKRGIGNDVISTFRLGYAMDSWNSLFNFLLKKDVSVSKASEVGLIIPKKTKGFYDRFRGRIIFPIINVQGRVVGFGGRVLDDSLPKYLNSPESIIYNKSNCLYGINIAKDFVRNNDIIIIVEGYLDLLSLNQYGIKNVVATLGTSLTSSHVSTLKRYTKNIVTIFDADDAGEKAATRSLDNFLKAYVSPKIATLPSGFDPDSFIKKVGKKAFEEIIAGSVPLIEFVTNEAIKKHDSSSMEGKIEIIQEISPLLSKIESRLERDLYIQEISRRLGIKESTIILELRNTKRGTAELQREDNKAMDKDLAERILLQLMLIKKEVIHKIRDEAVVEDFNNRRYKKIASLILSVFDKEGDVDPAKIMNQFEDESSKELVSLLLVQDGSIVDVKKTLKNCIYKVRMNKIKKERMIIDMMIKEAEEKRDELNLREFMISRQELMEKEKVYRQSFFIP